MRGTGVTCYEYILEQRIERSKDLVGLAGNAPVNVQGYLVGILWRQYM